MTAARPQGGADSRRSAAGPRPCALCGAPVLKQLVGRRAALDVTVDADPIPHEQAMALREPNRLAWCLAVRRGGERDVLWRCRTDCGHAVVIEHRCPPEALAYGRRPEGAMW